MASLTAGRTGWPGVCALSESGRRWWWGCASSRPRIWRWRCWGSSSPAVPCWRSIPRIRRRAWRSCWPMRRWR